MKRKFKRFIKNLSKKQKLLISIIAVFVISFTLVITFGRYIYNYYNNYILESKGFYFNSTVMSINGTKHSINNWDGVNPYPLTIDVNNKKNDLQYIVSGPAIWGCPLCNLEDDEVWGYKWGEKKPNGLDCIPPGAGESPPSILFIFSSLFLLTNAFKSNVLTSLRSLCGYGALGKS